MTDNSTGTVVPAFPPDGTQCLAMPGNLCTFFSMFPCFHVVDVVDVVGVN